MNGYKVALWSGLFAFLSNLLTISFFNFWDPDKNVEYLGASIVAILTAGCVFAKLKRDKAKEHEKQKIMIRTNFGRKKEIKDD